MRGQLPLWLFHLVLCTGPSLASISPAFSQFLSKTYGREAERLIARCELGSEGSFGGGKRREKARKRPVVFVHGLTNTAGEFEPVRRQFRRDGGYRDGELFATTYSCGQRTWLRDRMECRHVKQIRLLITAVAKYTHSPQVDVIGYSMGSALARKVGLNFRILVRQFFSNVWAILGGRCMDTREQLGPPLTGLVHTFIGVGGANRGAHPLCRIFAWAGPCNSLNGMACHSAFIEDINSGYGYEATARVYTVRSVDDGTVGNWNCEGQLASAIPGQHAEIVLHGYSHQMVVLGTAREQLRLLAADGGGY